MIISLKDILTLISWNVPWRQKKSKRSVFIIHVSLSYTQFYKMNIGRSFKLNIFTRRYLFFQSIKDCIEWWIKNVYVAPLKKKKNKKTKVASRSRKRLQLNKTVVGSFIWNIFPNNLFNTFSDNLYMEICIDQ